MLNRRDFCQTISLISVASLAQACSGGAGPSSIDAPPLPTIDANVVGGAITLTVDAVLRSRRSVPQPSCRPPYQNSIYICPCHGSEYSTSGTVLRGPASAPLQSFATRFVSPLLAITLA